MKHTPRIMATLLLVASPFVAIGTGYVWTTIGCVGVVGGLLTMLAEYCEPS